MGKYYFTFGSEGHDYKGGWCEVEAPDVNAAVAAFDAFHTRAWNGVLACCAIYEDWLFESTSMAKEGNFGKRCVERITLTREVL